MPSQLAKRRSDEAALQSAAAGLHRAAAIDLAGRPETWTEIPTDGPVRDLIAARANGPIPSVHLSSVAGRLAVLAVIAEMGERAGSHQVGWRDYGLTSTAAALSSWVPNLCDPHLRPLSAKLPALWEARETFRSIDDAALAHLAGRTFESATSCFWIFDDSGLPHRAWHPWIAKQQGCFFTPRFVARHMASAALRARQAPALTLDPAVGAGALLIEVFLKLRGKFGPERALGSLYGVDQDPALVELAALTLSFLAGAWKDGRPALLGSQLIAGDSLLAPLDGPESWRSWFPDVDGNGFDAVVMNPPYGQLKVNKSSLPPRRGDDRATQAIRERALSQARDRVIATSEALHRHPDYSFAHGGVPDLPRFFVERALSLLGEGSYLACIVPSTFLADHRSQAFRHVLLDDHSVKELDLIPEDAHLFPEVNQPTCILVAQAHRRTSQIRIRRRVLTSSDLRAKADVVISRELIAAADPVERRIPNCAPEDLEVLRAMHEHPRLDEHPWIANLRGELDLTFDARYLRSEPPGEPLVRGDQLERFRADLPSDKRRWVDSGFLVDGISPSKAAFISESRIVLRQCSYLRKPNRISGSLAQPGHVVANSCNFLAIRDPSATVIDPDASLLFLLGVLNSRLIDWRFRTTSSTNHVGNYELAALPIPVPDGREKTDEIVHLTAVMLGEPDHSSADDRLERAVRSLYGL